MKTLVFFSQKNRANLLSYNEDWLDAFRACGELQVDVCNLADGAAWLGVVPRIRQYGLIVFLHSTNSNEIPVPEVLVKALLFRRGKVALFVGNEYKLIPEKISLINRLRVDIIASQLPQDTAEWLYEECRQSRVVSIPHALNPRVFRPEVLRSKRRIDIGVRGYEYPWYLGDKERADLMSFVQSSQVFDELTLDISFDASKRFSRSEWAAFLNNCRATVSTEAGTSFLERDDATRLRVNAFLSANPKASFDEVYRCFFAGYVSPVSGKAISSRHFDAIGTKTVQIMFPGRFNDILKPDEHYIALKKDSSNLTDVLARLEDEKYCEAMTERAYVYAVSAHTHQHRIERLLQAIFSTEPNI